MHFITLLLALSSLASCAVLPTHHRKQPALSERDTWSGTRNDLSGPCLPVTIIFARGTVELGNVGTFAGPPFFNALADIIGDSNIAVQGVDYGATIAGYLEGGDPAGASTLASLTNEAASKCPDTLIILSGYRSGSQLTFSKPR